MSEYWAVPSTTDFMPGDDDMDAMDEDYAEFATAVAELAEKAVKEHRPVFQTLYGETPDFSMLSGILGYASVFGADQALPAAAKALTAIGDGQEKQRADQGLDLVNEFYGSLPRTGDKGGLGWRTEQDVEDDRWVDPTVARMELDEDPKKASEQLTDAIQLSLKTAMQDTWGPRAHGGNQSGKFEEDSQLQGGKLYTQHPGTQILFHVSRMLYNYAGTMLETKPTEVQTLLVADRIVVAANESIARDFLGSFVAAEAATLLDVIKQVVGDPDSFAYEAPKKSGEAGRVLEFSHQQTVEALKGLIAADKAGAIIAAAAATNEAGIVKSVVEAVTAGQQWEVGSYQEAIGWLGRADSRRGVFWMDPPDLGACHAEGALVALLVASGITTPAIIVGTMRPCTGCYLTLRFAKERLGANLVGAPSHNGGFWESTQTGGMLALVTAFSAGRLKHLKAYADADEDRQQEIDDAFKLEGVATFCRFVKRNFPESANASNLLGSETRRQSGMVPGPALRRTRTLDAKDYERYQAMKRKRAEEEPKPKPTPKPKNVKTVVTSEPKAKRRKKDES